MACSEWRIVRRCRSDSLAAKTAGWNHTSQCRVSFDFHCHSCPHHHAAFTRHGGSRTHAVRAHFCAAGDWILETPELRAHRLLLLSFALCDRQLGRVVFLRPSTVASPAPVPI